MVRSRSAARSAGTVPAAVAVGVGLVAVTGLLWYARHRRRTAALTA